MQWNPRGFNHLASEIKIFPIMWMNTSHVPSVKKELCQRRKEKLAFAQTPRESAFLMRLGRNKQTKIISCLCHQFKWRWLSPKVKCKNFGQVLCLKQNKTKQKKTKYKHTQPDSILPNQKALPLGWAKNVKIQTVASLHDSTKWIFNDMNHRMRESKECSHFILVKHHQALCCFPAFTTKGN